MIKISPKMALKYLALNTRCAVSIFSNLDPNTLHCLKVKLCRYNNSDKASESDRTLLLSAAKPILSALIVRITSSKRGDQQLFRSISTDENMSLLRSIDAAMPRAKKNALVVAEKRLKQRQRIFEKKPLAIPDATYSVITGKRKVRPKFKIKANGKIYRWSGRGKMPTVFKEAINGGASLQDFLIDDK